MQISTSVWIEEEPPTPSVGTTKDERCASEVARSYENRWTHVYQRQMYLCPGKVLPTLTVARQVFEPLSKRKYFSY